MERRQFGPPPVPTRMQEQGFLPRVVPPKHRWVEERRSSSREELSEPREPPVHRPVQSQHRLNNNERSFVNNNNSNSRVEELERRLEALEIERQRERQAVESKLSQVMEVVSRIARTSQQQQDGPMGNMRQHILALEETMASRNAKTERLAARVNEIAMSYHNMHQDLAQLKATILDRENKSKGEEEHHKLFQEIVRLGRLSEALNERMDQMKTAIATQLRAQENKIGTNQQALETTTVRLSETRDKAFQQLDKLGLQLQQLQHTTKSHAEELMVIKDRHTRDQENQEQVNKEFLSKILQVQDQSIAALDSKLGAFDQDLNQQREMDRQDRAAERADLQSRLSQLRETLEMDKRSAESKLQKLQERLFEKESLDQSLWGEFRSEIETRLDALSREIQREETDRIDSVRRVHEDVLDQLDGLYREGSASGGNGSVALSHIRNKLADLEEVVRAEVRSRMRHESKAKEHMEASVKSLQAENENVRSELESHINNLQQVLDESFATAEEKMQDRMSQLESQVVEDKHSRQMAQSDFEQRISSCEAKLAKTIAVNGIEMDRLETLFNERHGALESQVLLVEENLATFQDATQQSIAQIVDQASHVARGECEKLQESFHKLEHDVSKKTEQAEAKIDATLTMTQDLEARLHLIVSEMEQLRDEVQTSEAKNASESCMEDILREIEAQEKENEWRVRQQESENRLQENLSAILVSMDEKLSSTTNTWDEKMRALSTAFDTLMKDTKASQQNLREKIETDQSKIAALSDELHQQLAHLQSTSLSRVEELDKQLQQQHADVQAQLAMEKMIQAVATQETQGSISSLREEFETASQDVTQTLETLHASLGEKASTIQELGEKLNGFITSMQQSQKEQEQIWKSIEQAQDFLFLEGNDNVQTQDPKGKELRVDTEKTTDKETIPPPPTDTEDHMFDEDEFKLE